MICSYYCFCSCYYDCNWPGRYKARKDHDRPTRKSQIAAPISHPYRSYTESIRRLICQPPKPGPPFRDDLTCVRTSCWQQLFVEPGPYYGELVGDRLPSMMGPFDDTVQQRSLFFWFSSTGSRKSHHRLPYWPRSLVRADKGACSGLSIDH